MKNKRLYANWIAAILYEIKIFKISCLRSSGVPVGPKKSPGGQGGPRSLEG